MAAIIIASLTLIARVDTQVAIAFGASVQPLTTITPRVSRVETKSIGELTTCCKKLTRDINAPLPIMSSSNDVPISAI